MASAQRDEAIACGSKSAAACNPLYKCTFFFDRLSWFLQSHLTCALAELIYSKMLYPNVFPG